jgi:hypothetical protein
MLKRKSMDRRDSSGQGGNIRTQKNNGNAYT